MPFRCIGVPKRAHLQLLSSHMRAYVFILIETQVLYEKTE